jgi:Fe2+ or Zn2+ uptake regulation protein
MTCLGCGRVAELACPSLELIENEVSSECRFYVADVRVELSGYCAHCRV